MRIALDDRAPTFSGMGIYTKSLANIYQKLGHEVWLYHDDLAVSRNSFLQKYFNFLRRILRENFHLVKWLQKNSIDIYHASRNMGVPLFPSISIVVTIHDVIPIVFPKQYLGNILERLYYKISLRLSVNNSKKIITVSEFTKKELINFYGIEANKIIVVPNGYNNSFRRIYNRDLLQAIKEKYKLDEKFILSIGGSEYRKNMQRLIHVYQKHFSGTYKLIVIGGKWRNTDLPGKYASDKNIRFLTNIPEEDLIAIYNMAEVFVFPSFYEGFGIPVLEGMACGVPVVTSNVSSMPEVGGEAAIYFDPFNEEDMAVKIDKVLQDETLRKTMIAKGLERVKEYSWEKCAAETLRVYREVIKND